MQGWPALRRFAFYAAFGDKNFAQVVHNLPLVLLGYACRRDTLVPLAAPRHWAVTATLCLLTFVADPLLFGLFPQASRRRAEEPLYTYCRAGLRLAALFSLLPRRRTALTDAGRSQLLAYLLHDAVFSLGWLLLSGGSRHVGGTYSEWKQAAAASWESATTGPLAALGTAAAAAALLVAYVGLALALQVALSRPRDTAAAVSGAAAAASRFAGAAYLHARLALLGGLRARGGAGYKRVPSAEAEID